MPTGNKLVDVMLRVLCSAELVSAPSTAIQDGPNTVKRSKQWCGSHRKKQMRVTLVRRWEGGPVACLQRSSSFGAINGDQ
jgi:hypothetical protein